MSMGGHCAARVFYVEFPKIIVYNDGKSIKKKE